MTLLVVLNRHCVGSGPQLGKARTQLGLRQGWGWCSAGFVGGQNPESGGE